MKQLTDLQDINDGAIEKMKATIKEIDILLDDVDDELSTSATAKLKSRRGMLSAQITNQELVNAHLKAAATIIEFKKAEEAELDAINEEFDALIISGLKITAFLDVAKAVQDAAKDIASKIDSHATLT